MCEPGSESFGLRCNLHRGPQRMTRRKPDKLAVVLSGQAMRTAYVGCAELFEPRAAKVAPHTFVVIVRDKFAQRREVRRPILKPAEHAPILCSD